MNNAGTVASSVSRLYRHERHKTALQPAHWLILILIGTCEFARQLQFHYLCRLNPFIPCICTLTFVNHAHEHINIPKYTAFQDGSWKPGCNKRDRYSNFHFIWNYAVFHGHAHASSSVTLQHTQNFMRTHAYNSLLPQFTKESSVVSPVIWAITRSPVFFVLVWEQ